MTAAQRWLVDKSALRPGIAAFADILIPRIAAGRVHVCLITELEVVYSARSSSDLDRIKRDVLGPLISLVTPIAAETRARQIQDELVVRGQHRAVALPDLIVAATAEAEGLVVLHYDRDFDLIGEVTGQAMEWVIPRGTA